MKKDIILDTNIFFLLMSKGRTFNKKDRKDNIYSQFDKEHANNINPDRIRGLIIKLLANDKEIVVDKFVAMEFCKKLKQFKKMRDNDGNPYLSDYNLAIANTLKDKFKIHEFDNTPLLHELQEEAETCYKCFQINLNVDTEIEKHSDTKNKTAQNFIKKWKKVYKWNEKSQSLFKTFAYLNGNRSTLLNDSENKIVQEYIETKQGTHNILEEGRKTGNNFDTIKTYFAKKKELQKQVESIDKRVNIFKNLHFSVDIYLLAKYEGAHIITNDKDLEFIKKINGDIKTPTVETIKVDSLRNTKSINRLDFKKQLDKII